MRKITAYEFYSLDGFMAAPNDGMEWVTENFSPDIEKEIAATYKKADTLLFGRTTYQSLAGFWPNVTTREEPLADFMNEMDKIVFSKTLSEGDMDWNNSSLLTGEITEEIEKLKKAAGKDMIIIGSAQLVQLLTRNGLIDEYKILLFPVLLGQGKPLFTSHPKRLKLNLKSVEKFAKGVLLLNYMK